MKNLPMALEIAKRNKRKMAKGGPVSAKSEKRPMPEEKDNDLKSISHNSGKKAPSQDKMTDQPERKQSMNDPKPKLQPIKAGKMAASSVIKASPIDALGQRLDAVEKHLMDSDAPSSDKDQPSESMDEKGANRQGPKVHPMKKMAQGGMANEHTAAAEDDHAEHPEGLESDNDQIRPPSKEYMAGYMQAHKHMMAEGGKVKSLDEAQGEAQQEQSEMESQHEAEREASMKPHAPAKAKMIREDEMYADGGMIDLDEVEEEKHASIAAAIMSKKKRGKQDSDSDEDHMAMMAEGGQVDLSRNADEDPNEEDQLSYEALKKENYSESAGLNQLDQPKDSNEEGDEREKSRSDKHDRIKSIRAKSRKMRK